MEQHTAKTSTNSSKPSSQTPKDESAISGSGTHGKGKALDQARSRNTRTVETVQVAKFAFCEHCGEDLRKVPCRWHERRTQSDFDFRQPASSKTAALSKTRKAKSGKNAPLFADSALLWALT